MNHRPRDQRRYNLAYSFKYNSLVENSMLISKCLKTSVPIKPFIPKSV
ncbi:hypothetical protein D1AOALGA4SA_3316 [Olavius algarvensis Delta 1 endosymbiont]|nr:hypothetical protein D1AOALGA4SA_3316 [Olavius algarvensis Delta 1 endosymbiont]